MYVVSALIGDRRVEQDALPAARRLPGEGRLRQQRAATRSTGCRRACRCSPPPCRSGRRVTVPAASEVNLTPRSIPSVSTRVDRRRRRQVEDRRCRRHRSGRGRLGRAVGVRRGHLERVRGPVRQARQRHARARRGHRDVRQRAAVDVRRHGVAGDRTAAVEGRRRPADARRLRGRLARHGGRRVRSAAAEDRHGVRCGRLRTLPAGVRGAHLEGVGAPRRQAGDRRVSCRTRSWASARQRPGTASPHRTSRRRRSRVRSTKPPPTRCPQSR